VNPLTAIYGAVIRARNRHYDEDSAHARRLSAPVVSIGNLSMGGSGKTPFLILLGELLKQRGIQFDVLSRGYRRKSKGVVLVDANGTAQEFGDEPLLIARRLGVPVVVGEERWEAGKFAEQKYGPQLHLLDDGFQHRRLARDFDIVLLAPGDAEDSLLPAGRLREPLESVRRANAVILTEGASPTGLPVAEALIWRLSRGLEPLSMPAPCIAFCGIAKPQNFFAQLRAAGVPMVATRAFRDHHAYSAGDLHGLLQLRRKWKAAAFVTTEKDAANLGNRLKELEPIQVARVVMRLEEADRLLEAILKAVAKNMGWQPSPPG
jgi:tetraacyldisaccharide 4'-kinase